MSDVWVGETVTITLTFQGRFPDGTTCELAIYPYVDGHRGDEAVVTEQVPLAGTVARYEWKTADDLLEDDELSKRFHYEAKVDGARGKRTTDTGDVRVWARSITVLGKGEDGNVLAGALLRLTSPNPDAGLRSRLYHLTDEDTEGLEVELWERAEPRLTWDLPFELVAWEKVDGRKRVASVRLPPWRAVFKQYPERGAPPGSELTRKQYVNLADPRRRSHGPTVTLQIGANQRGAERQEVYVEVKLTGPDGGPPSLRYVAGDPRPELVGGVAAEEMTYDFNGATGLRRPVKWTAHAAMDKLDEHGQAYAELTLHVGRAGGDTFTIKIGHDDTCGDGSLAITTWRHLAYKLFYPAPALSDFGKLSKGDDLMDAKHVKGAADEAARAYIEYVMGVPEAYDQSDWPGLDQVLVHDAKVFGGSSGKSVVAADSDLVKILADKCKLTHRIEAHEQPVFIVDYLIEKVKQRNTYTSPPIKSHDALLALGDRPIQLTVDRNEYFFPLRLEKTGPVAGIKLLKLCASKVTVGGASRDGNGIAMYLGMKEMAARNDPRTPRLSDAELQLYRFTAPSGAVEEKNVFAWKEADPPDTQAGWVEFVAKGKIKLTPDPEHPAIRNLQALWALYPDLEITVYLEFEKFKSAGAAGMSIGDGILLYPSTASYTDSDLDLTFLHELSHALGHAYGSRLSLGGSGLEQPIDGVDFRKPLHELNPPRAAGGGLIYIEHGHTGGHCAEGLTYDDAIKDGEPVEFGFFKLRKMTCLNNGGSPSHRTKFCDECLKVIRASDVSVRK